MICSVATGVQAGRGFVQKNDGRVFQEHAGDGDFLLLAAGQVLGRGIVTQGQGLDLLMDKGLAGCFQNFLASGFGLAVADVFLHRAVEDVVFLEYQADVAAYEGCVVVGQRHARPATVRRNRVGRICPAG